MRRPLCVFCAGTLGLELVCAFLPQTGRFVPFAAFFIVGLLWALVGRLRKSPAWGYGICLILGAVLGLVLTGSTQAKWDAIQTAYDGRSVLLEAEVESTTSSYFPGRVRAVLRVETVNREAASLRVECASLPTCSPGDRVKGRFALEMPDDTARLNALADGIALNAAYEKGFALLGQSTSFRARTARLQKRLSAALRQGMASGPAGVLAAMVTGDRSGITQELRTVYSRSGLSHLLAVSGLHTGIVFALVNLMLWWLPLLHRGHLVRNLLATVCIWLFVAAAGFSPSAVRAAVMCTMLQFALASASEYVALNALAAAGFGMLLWNPAWLGDISFQLSFIAVAAILAWGVPLCRLLHTRRRALNLLTDALVISLVAGIATAPLVSHTFGTVPLAGLLVNPVAILVGSIVVLGGTVWMILPVNWLAPAFDAVLSGTAGLLNTLARAAAALPGGYAEYTLGGGATAGIYLFFLLTTLAAWSFEPKKSVHLPA